MYQLEYIIDALCLWEVYDNIISYLQAPKRLERIGIIGLSVIGFRCLLIIAREFYTTYVAPAMGLNVDVQDMGKWAVVVGATDGLGRAYCYALAKRGMNIAMIGKSSKKLEAIAIDLETEHRIQCKIIKADISDPTYRAYKVIEREIRDLQVGVLINYTGVCYPQPEYFLELPRNEKIYAHIIRTNVMCVVKMTTMLLPQMLKRGRGVVVTISSTVTSFRCPMLTVYSASKAVVEKFTEDLRDEYNDQGIITQCLRPGYLANSVRMIKESSWMAPSPALVVENALNTLGVVDSTVGHYPHAVVVSIIELFESVCPPCALSIITFTMESIRKKVVRRYVD